ncbi:MAG: septal ring lytic transglycosylase RlpA family protein [Magnetococcales bacterium]|nr:septal ring lytic transglycosylase RlpA family protein [Magnetococcales bacterium]
MRTRRFEGLKHWVALVWLLSLAACTTLPPEKPEPGTGKPPSGVKRGTSRPYEVFGKMYYPLTEEEAAGYSEEGMASWYGKEFHERPTANGERFDMYKVSAAHTTLPLPILVRVTNLDNGRTLNVRVNDRGPFIDNRLIDLSYAAAEQLGYANRGLARVRVEAVNMLAKADSADLYRARPGTPPSPLAKPDSVLRSSSKDSPWKENPWKESSSAATGSGNGRGNANAANANGIGSGSGSVTHYIQLGSFGRYENAQVMERRVNKVSKPKIIKSSVGARVMYRVRLGPFSTAEQAEQVVQTLRKMDISESVIIRE